MTAAADLSAAMFAAAGRVDQSVLNHIERLGVGREAFAQLTPALNWPCVGICDAEPAGNGLFAIGGGKTHVVQPVVTGGAIVDLCAWRSTHPDDWSLLRGVGWLLGADAVDYACEWPQDGPIAMHRRPLDWMAAGSDGFCVLDWSAPEIRSLAYVDAIDFPDADMRDMLLAVLSKPPRLPRVTIGRRGYAS